MLNVTSSFLDCVTVHTCTLQVSEEYSVWVLDFLCSHLKKAPKCLCFLRSTSTCAVYSSCIHYSIFMLPFLPSPSLLTFHLLYFSESLETFLCVDYCQGFSLLFSPSLLTLVSPFFPNSIFLRFCFLSLQTSPKTSVSLQIWLWWTEDSADVLKNTDGCHKLTLYAILPDPASQILRFLVLWFYWKLC